LTKHLILATLSVPISLYSFKRTRAGLPTTEWDKCFQAIGILNVGAEAFSVHYFLISIKERGLTLMTKSELIDKIASDVGLSKADAGRALDATLDTIRKALKKNQKVTLVGFGTFSVSKRKSRTGRNPRTGEAIKIPATKVPKFTAGKGLKDSIK
jgi:DNA-binding protein HU-beta